MMLRPLSILLSSLLLSMTFDNVEAAAVMSVDLGAQWMKIAVVSPGVPMEIALNPESKRKTAVAVALRPDERLFGSDALATCVKYPKQCYFNLLSLLAKPIDHPEVERFKAIFPYYQLEAHPERKTVLFRHDDQTLYSPEELLAMILEHARQVAEKFTEQNIRDAVITVPVYFNQAERRAIMTAAQLANINVLQLISEPMAVALNYGMFRRKEINGTARNLMFYDMGAQDTTVSIASFQVIQTKDRGFTETHPQAQVLAVGYERHLGGFDIQIALRDFLASEFNALKKASVDVRTVPRAMGKLLKEAERVKMVLSANTNVFAQIENVMEDIDFKLEVSRDKLLELNQEFFQKVTLPVDQALAAASMTMDEISEVILVGAGTRIPRVQELLQSYFGTELGKNLNTDESAAMGAVYKAADLSTGFKVKKFLTKEAVILPIDVDFERQFENDEGELVNKKVKRSLFAKMNVFPQKKVITFNKHTDDFLFHVNHNDLDHLSLEERKNIGSLNLTEVSVNGLGAALKKYADNSSVESKGVKAHFHMDESGLLNLTAVEIVFERTVSVEEQVQQEQREKEEQQQKGEDENSDTWKNLGDTISSFFSNDEDGKDGQEGKDSEAKKDEKTTEPKKSEKGDGNKKEEANKKKKEEKPKKPKIVNIKEPLNFTVQHMDLPDLTLSQLQESADKLDTLNQRDAKKRARETALNNLESYVIDTRDKMNQGNIYEESLTKEERDDLEVKLSEVGEWIDDEVTPDTEEDELNKKLADLKKLTQAWLARVKEHTDRPEALDALKAMIEKTKEFVEKAQNSTGKEGYFTETEVNVLQKKLDDVVQWRKDMEEEQDKMELTQMPKMTTGLIAEKVLELDREVKYLVNKAKIVRAEREKQRLKEEEERKKREEEEQKKNKEKKNSNKTETTEDDSGDDKGSKKTDEDTKDEVEKDEETVEETEETTQESDDEGEKVIGDDNKKEEDEEDVEEASKQERSEL